METSILYYPQQALIPFVAMWLYIIPVVFTAYALYGLRAYLRKRRNSDC